MPRQQLAHLLSHGPILVGVQISDDARRGHQLDDALGIEDLVVGEVLLDKAARCQAIGFAAVSASGDTSRRRCRQSLLVLVADPRGRGELVVERLAIANAASHELGPCGHLRHRIR